MWMKGKGGSTRLLQAYANDISVCESELLWRHRSIKLCKLELARPVARAHEELRMRGVLAVHVGVAQQALERLPRRHLHQECLVVGKLHRQTHEGRRVRGHERDGRRS